MAKTIKINIKEGLLVFSLATYLCSVGISFFTNEVFYIPYSTYIVIALIYVPIVYLWVTKQIKIPWDAIAFVIGVAIVFGITLFIHPEYKIYYTRNLYGVWYRVLRPDRAIYLYLLIRIAVKEHIIVKALKYSSYVMLLYGVCKYAQVLKVGYWEDINYAGEIVRWGYSLSFGYNIMLATTVFMYLAFKQKKYQYWILAILGTVLIVVAGSRGPILCLVIFAMLFVLNSVKELSKTKRTLLLIAMITVIAFFMLADIPGLLQGIQRFLANNGINSRTLDKFLSGNIAEVNSRDIIWSRAIDMIKDGGLLGYGVYGDRPVISRIHYSGYSHNLFLELLISFGPIVGGLISLALVWGSIKMILFCKKEEWKELFMIFFAATCMLFLSMSLWYVSYIWGAIAIVVNYKKQDLKENFKGENCEKWYK